MSIRWLEQPDEDLAVSAPEANAHEFQFGGVIEMLEKLLDKFIHQNDVSVEPQTVYHIFVSIGNTKQNMIKTMNSILHV